MSLQDLVLGSYGFVVVIEIIDTETEAALDVSGYTSYAMEFSDPEGVLITKAAELYSDGTDGKIKYTVASGDIGVAGAWKVRAKVYTGATIVLYSTWARFPVTD